MKISDFFYLKNCHFLVVNFSAYLNRRVFVMSGAKLIHSILSKKVFSSNIIPQILYGR